MNSKDPIISEITVDLYVEILGFLSWYNIGLNALNTIKLFGNTFSKSTEKILIQMDVAILFFM